MPLQIVNADDGQYYNVLYFGGARRSQESTWGFGKNLFEITYYCEPDDVSITEINKCETMGSLFPSLQSAAACVVESKIYVWGGLDTDLLDTKDELFILEKRGKKYDCKLLQKDDSRSCENRKFQDGEIPAGRTGHTVMKISNDKFILYGGVSMKLRHCVGLTSPFSQVCDDGAFYIFDLSHLRWTRLSNIPEIQPRAYHTATTFSLSGTMSVIFIGGVTYSNSSPSQRIAVNECVILKAHDITNNHFTLDKIVFEMEKPSFISYHSCTAINQFLYITGGFVQDEKQMTDKPLTNHHIIILDTENNRSRLVEIDSSFSTAGNTSITIYNECLMVVGGVAENFFVYTTKALKPTACDLSVECKIDVSPEISPIAWIQCESACQRWLHQFCVGLLTQGVPKEKYICSDCRGTKSKKNGRSNIRHPSVLAKVKSCLVAWLGQRLMLRVGQYLFLFQEHLTAYMPSFEGPYFFLNISIIFQTCMLWPQCLLLSPHR